MAFKPYNHFVTRNFQSHAGFLPDDVYSQVLDSIVVACVDIVVVDSQGRMLLGFRAYEPMPGWWIIGGRMKPGESFEQAASRNIQRELDLAVEPDRFKHLCTFNLVWATRRQEPQDRGSHTISITMALFLSQEEADAIQVTEEYLEFKWSRPENITVEYHPAVIRYASILKRSWSYRLRFWPVLRWFRWLLYRSPQSTD